MQIENEHTFLAGLNEGLHLFLGSGFSVLASDEQGNVLPVGSGLQQELVKLFGVPENLGLSQIATLLNSTRKAEFRSFLNTRFTVSEFDPRYAIIEQMPVKSIITTNIDNLLHEIYRNGTTSYLNDLDLRGSTFFDRSAVDLVTLHGCVLHDSKDLTFGDTELASAFAREPDRWYFLARALETGPTLFWGYSLSDESTLGTLHPSTTQGRELGDKWITVRPGTDDGTLQYLRALNFQIIECETDEFLDYLHQHFEPTSQHQLEASTGELFPELSIPDVGAFPVRPIFEYFRGSPPTWYDIYSGQISTTSHHAVVRNALNAKKHTLIVGIPGSGKTTLLMQVIKDFNFSGHKLFADCPTPERAELIINRLAGAPALIGVDNFADDLDGFNVLLNSPNVLVLGCDETYWMETVSHRLPWDKLEVIDVTDLSAEDIQTIVNRIPADVRSSNQSLAQGEGQIPSIFEIVEARIKLPKLSQRYRSVLSSLERDDPRLLEFLLVCAYVHSCRTPISMDMLLAFFRGSDVDYVRISEMRNRMSGIVVDYLGDYDDGAQDYYRARSTLLSQAVMNQATALQLKNVILRFHGQVSSYRIHRYDVFKRRAFDHDLMDRVFRDWKEGMDFYKNAHLKETNPYVLQQGALFLSGKKRYQEAFNMIDESLAVSNRRIPSIRNSHATILFSANIDRTDTDGMVQRTLRQSMNILSECYNDDQRKAYHAQTFADQALRYDTRYGTAEGRNYLETALSWLKEEQAKSPWHREVRRLAAVVVRRLNDGRDSPRPSLF